MAYGLKASSCDPLKQFVGNCIKFNTLDMIWTGSLVVAVERYLTPDISQKERTNERKKERKDGDFFLSCINGTMQYMLTS